MKPMQRKGRIRILHIVGGMTRGGIETWLMHVLRHIDRERFQMDFLVHTTEPCPYDDEIRALGGQVIPCPNPGRPWIYAGNFRRILAKNGPYDVVHSHVHHYSGYTLRLAREAGIPGRIAHSHNDTSRQEVSSGFFRRIYLSIARRMIWRHATTGLAAGGKAADALFGPAWQADPLYKVLYCAIDLEPFRNGIGSALRAELKIQPDAFVIGHVGRFEEQKNHRFLLEIVRRVVDSEPKTRLLLLGDGSLRPAIQQHAADLGLVDHVIFAGLRADVPHILNDAVDVFVMPSFFEGVPLAGLEAQAAGLPCVLSDTITSELDVVPQLIHRVSLSRSPAVWAETILSTRLQPWRSSRPDAFAAVEASPFNIRRSVTELEQLYASYAAPRGADYAP